MSDLNLTCGGKYHCTSQVVIACNCGNPVVFLCENCVLPHLRAPHPHLFLQLDQASRILNDAGFSQNYIEVYSKYAKIKAEIGCYVKNLVDFRTRVISFKHEIMRDIEANVDAGIEKIDYLLNYAYKKLSELDETAGKLDRVDEDIMRNYEDKGIEGIIDRYVNIFKVNDERVRKAVRHMITLGRKAPVRVVRIDNETQLSHKPSSSTPLQIQDLTLPPLLFSNCLNLIPNSSTSLPPLPHPKLPSPTHHSSSISDFPQPASLFSPSDFTSTTQIPVSMQPDSFTSTLPLSNSSSSCLFVPYNNSKTLLQFDTASKTLSSYSLSSSILHPFFNSSLILLPDNKLLIAGGISPIEPYPNIGDTYLIDITSSPISCSYLCSLNHPRCCSKLVYHNSFIYMLGGKSSKTVEKMRLGDSQWLEIPSMKERRYDFGVFVSSNRIYIIGGFANYTVEYYDVHRNESILLEGVFVRRGGAVCAEVNDRIYVVGSRFLHVFSKEFELIESRDKMGKPPGCYSNVVVSGEEILYASSKTEKVYAFNTRDMSLIVLAELSVMSEES
jgi:hypothetical protein